jgi:surfactin synthase thioesterase subunit
VNHIRVNMGPVTGARNTSRWLLRRPSGDAAARLFCFPYSGCGASIYHQWPRRIGQIEVCAIQPPARENRIREPHYGTYEALASALIEFLPPYLDRPFAFFGHCGGALPGVELTYQLHQAGLPAPERVFVSSQVAPHHGPFGRFLGLGVDELASELRHLILSSGREPRPGLVQLSLDVLLQDLEANRRYRPASLRKLPCAVTVIGWTEDTEIPMRMMDGWRELSFSCRYALLEGKHYDFLAAPPTLLAEIERDFIPAGMPVSAPRPEGV